MNDKLVICLNCGSDACYEYEQQKILVWSCMGCGFTSNELMIEGSQLVTETEEVMPELYKNIKLNKGVYASVQGPNLETRAEYRMLKILGADAVGMSTVPEVIACNHMSLPCCCISVLTDECDPEHLAPVDISEIIATAKKAEVLLTSLYCDLIKSL